MYIKYPHFVRKNVKMLTLGVASIVGSFVVGIQSAGNLQPVSLIEAGGMTQAGDIDGSGVVDVQDALLILEVVQGYAVPTSDQLLADPNRDGALTVEDAYRILSGLSLL